MNENHIPDYIEHMQHATTGACSFVAILSKDCQVDLILARLPSPLKMEWPDAYRRKS